MLRSLKKACPIFVGWASWRKVNWFEANQPRRSPNSPERWALIWSWSGIAGETSLSAGGRGQAADTSSTMSTAACWSRKRQSATPHLRRSCASSTPARLNQPADCSRTGSSVRDLGSGLMARRPRSRRGAMAERVGFEPTLRFHVNRISSAAHSTTLPPLQAPFGRAGKAPEVEGAIPSGVVGGTQAPGPRFLSSEPRGRAIVRMQRKKRGLRQGSRRRVQGPDARRLRASKGPRPGSAVPARAGRAACRIGSPRGGRARPDPGRAGWRRRRCAGR